jgi:hypothetical protein
MLASWFTSDRGGGHEGEERKRAIGWLTSCCTLKRGGRRTLASILCNRCESEHNECRNSVSLHDQRLAAGTGSLEGNPPSWRR